MEKSNIRKKPYQKPAVTRFPLRPEEAVLGNCKMSGSSGASAMGCFLVNPCRTIGS